MNKRILASTLFTVIASLSLSAVNAKERKDPDRGKPPTEAFDVCASKSVDDSCSFTSSRAEATGTCQMPLREGEQLVYAPEGGRPPEA